MFIAQQVVLRKAYLPMFKVTAGLEKRNLLRVG